MNSLERAADSNDDNDNDSESDEDATRHTRAQPLRRGEDSDQNSGEESGEDSALQCM